MLLFIKKKKPQRLLTKDTGVSMEAPMIIYRDLLITMDLLDSRYLANNSCSAVTAAAATRQGTSETFARRLPLVCIEKAPFCLNFFFCSLKCCLFFKT